MATPERRARSPAVSRVALGALLESTPCPAELRQLVTSNLGDDAGARIGQRVFAGADVLRAPGAAGGAADLARRAEPLLEQARAAEALEQLTERARHEGQRVDRDRAGRRDASFRVATPSALRPASSGRRCSWRWRWQRRRSSQPRKRQTRRPCPPTSGPIADDEDDAGRSGGCAARAGVGGVRRRVRPAKPAPSARSVPAMSPAPPAPVRRPPVTNVAKTRAVGRTEWPRGPAEPVDDRRQRDRAGRCAAGRRVARSRQRRRRPRRGHACLHGVGSGRVAAGVGEAASARRSAGRRAAMGSRARSS